MKTIAPTLRRSFKLKALILATLLPGLSVLPVPLQANPYGPNVVAGGANFQGLGTANLNVNQSSNTAIINWQGFSIANGEITTFNQPGVNSVALNRVVTGNPSAIYGTLQANGSILLINPNGIVVGPNGMVDVAGMLTMSTLDVDDDDFLDGGSMRFTGTSGAGVTNYGAISSANGDVVLLGNFLQNAGSVRADGGTIAFGQGGDILLEQGISGATISVRGGAPGDGGIVNSGTVSAAAVQFEATGNAASVGIQNSGVIRANGASTRGGRVMLRAMGGSSLVNTGQVSARNYDGSGGQISIEGGDVHLQAGELEAAGVDAAGGSVDVLGNNVIMTNAASINASGTQGGSVSLIAAAAMAAHGKIDATGSVGNGGDLDVTGNGVVVGSTAEFNVSGQAAGGRARIGGGFQGNDADIMNSQMTSVDEGALVLADSEDGNGGTIVFWSDGDTTFNGEAHAQARGLGNGGLVEVSGKNRLRFSGFVSTLSEGGVNGTLLLDPTNLTIGRSGDDVDSESITTALQGGNVVIHTASAEGQDGIITIEQDADLTYDSDNHLSFFAHGSIFIYDDIQNAGAGNVNIFAGWDGTGAENFSAYDPTDPDTVNNIAAGAIFAADLRNTDNFGEWGNGGGVIEVTRPSGQTAISVGSADGETNVFGGVIRLIGAQNERSVQIGFRRLSDGIDYDANNGAHRTPTHLANDPAVLRQGGVSPTTNYFVDADPTGDINVQAKFQLNMDTGPRAHSHVMIGHGGSNLDNRNNTSNQYLFRTGHDIPAGGPNAGNFDLAGDIYVEVEFGDLEMKSGHWSAFSQIGHGGWDVDGTKTGDITVLAASVDIHASAYNGRGENAHAMIGHGGRDSTGAATGDIRVISQTFIRGTSTIQDNTNTSNNFQNNSRADFVQIGHGGWQSGAVPFNGIAKDSNSEGSRAVSETLGGHSGAIYLEAIAGDIEFTASSRHWGYAQVGHGGYRAHGNHNLTSTSGDSANDGLTLKATGDILFDRFSPELDTTLINGGFLRQGDRSFVQAGLGGMSSIGRFSGDIFVDAGGVFEMHAGDGNDAYAQLGHGGSQFTNGNINNERGHATLSGDIMVTTGGNFELYSGSSEDRAFAMVGHGGYRRIADYKLTSAGAGNGYVIAQTEWGHHGDISIDSGGDIIVQARPKDDALLGNTVAGDLGFAMVGHGGWDSRGDHWGAITLNAEGNIDITAGRGGYEEFRDNLNYGPGDGSETWHTRPWQWQWGYGGTDHGRYNWASVGHGGKNSGLLSNASWQGYQFNGNAEGKGFGAAGNSDITITAGGDLTLTALQEIGAIRDDITTQYEFVGNNVAFDTVYDTMGRPEASNGRPIWDGLAPDPNDPDTVLIIGERAPIIVSDSNYALIGHGGEGQGGNAAQIRDRNQLLGSVNSGDITIEVGGEVNLQAGEVAQKDEVQRNLSSDRAPAVRDVGYLRDNYAQIGHGGYLNSTGYDGDISIIAGSNVNLNAGWTQRDLARIGHGGYNAAHIQENDFAANQISGNISVKSGASINVNGGPGNYDNYLPGTTRIQFNYSQIGHGALGRDQEIDGDITLVAVEDVAIMAGYGDGGITGGGPAAGLQDAYAHVGHGGLGTGTNVNSDNNATNGNFSGDIDITAGDDIIMDDTSGQAINGQLTSASNYSKIGHGDSNSGRRAKGTGVWNGDIALKAGNDLISEGGTIGHTDFLNSPNSGNADEITTWLSGDTFIAVGRNGDLSDPGEIILNNNAATMFNGGSNLGTPLVSRVTSGLKGLGPAAGQIRVYIPTTPGNQIAAGTSFNEAAYVDTPASGTGRGDELVATEFFFTYDENGMPMGDFTPEGAYTPDPTFGSYNVYFADPTAFLPPPPLPPEPVPPFVPNFLSALAQLGATNAFLFEAAAEGWDEDSYLYYTDAFGNVYLVGLALDDVVYETDADGNLYYTFAEDALDSVFGNGDGGDMQIINREQAEEQLRRLRQAEAGTSGGLTFFAYNPDTNRYSSYRVFGVPASGLRPLD